jgi:hypothetical protein
LKRNGVEAPFDERLLCFSAFEGGHIRALNIASPKHLIYALPVPPAVTLVTISAAITLADFSPFLLIDAGTAQALAIAYLAAFATIAATIAFAILAELLLIVALIAKIRAVVAGGRFLNKRFHLGGAVRKAGADRCSRGNRNACEDTRSCNYESENEFTHGLVLSLPSARA